MNKKLTTLFVIANLGIYAFAANSTTGVAASAPAKTPTIAKSKPAASAAASSNTTISKDDASAPVSGVVIDVENCNQSDTCKIVSDTTSSVLKIINTRPFSNQAVNDILKVVIPNFDFELMTRLAVGRGWDSATTEQRSKLISSFKNLLIYTYSSALFKFKGSQITIVSASTDGKKSAVVTHVVLPNGTSNQPVNVEYDLANTIKTGNVWKTYDIKIENASLVTTYRNQFTEVIDSSGIDGLITQLESKVNNLRKTKSS